MKITDEQRDIILRRGDEAEAFLHSPLFVAIKEWVDQEESQIARRIGQDFRTEAQKGLTRMEFVEQTTGYYNGLLAFLGLFKGFVSLRDQMNKQLAEEQKAEEEKATEQAKREELKRAAGHK